MAIRSRTYEEVSINLTPMIDVVFLLVIFFMVGAKFTDSDGQMDLHVPGIGNLKSLVREPDQRVVELSHVGTVTLDSQPISLPKLQTVLRTAHESYSGLRVTVRGDVRSSLKQFAEVVQVVRRSGVENVAFVPIQR